MKVVIQRVLNASCVINDEIYSKIDKGFLLLVGIGQDDNKDIIDKVASKISKLRIFSDENDKMNKSLEDVGGKVLSISQFTLYADCKKGNRPSFTNALGGKEASDLYDYFNNQLRNLGQHVETGIFGADMKINLINDGPVTIILDSREI